MIFEDIKVYQSKQHFYYEASDQAIKKHLMHIYQDHIKRIYLCKIEYRHYKSLQHGQLEIYILVLIMYRNFCQFISS